MTKGPHSDFLRPEGKVLRCETFLHHTLVKTTLVQLFKHFGLVDLHVRYNMQGGSGLSSLGCEISRELTSPGWETWVTPPGGSTLRGKLSGGGGLSGKPPLLSSNHHVYINQSRLLLGRRTRSEFSGGDPTS